MKTNICIASLVCLTASAACAAGIYSDEAATTALNNALYSNLNLPDTGSVDVSSAWSEATSNHFTLVATLDVAQLARWVGSDAEWSGNETMNFFNVKGTKQLGAKLFVYSNWNGITGFHSGTSTGDFGSSASNPMLHRLQGIDLSDVMSAAITFTHQDADHSSMVLTLVSSTGQTSYYGTNTGFKWSGGFGALQELTYDTSLVTSAFLLNEHYGDGMDKLNTAAIAAKAAAVPEPATATLSLLALAGLAARRRRK